jgi:dihydroneopterin aldolase
MDTITIKDLEVNFCVGVPDEERARAQKLLITVEMERDFTTAAASDEVAETIDYFAVTQRIAQFGEGAHWKLIETLALDVAQMILEEFRPARVTVEVKKFILPNTRYVSVKATRPAGSRS